MTAKNSFKKIDEEDLVFLQAVGEPIMLLGDGLKILWSNAACCQLWGYDWKDLRRTTFESLLARSSRSQFCDSPARFLNQTFELEGIKRSGQPFVFQGQLRAGPETEAPCWILSGHEVTLEKRTLYHIQKEEEKYREIFENAVIGIFRTSPEGHYLSANRALAQIYGYESPDQLISGLNDITSQLYVDPTRRDDFVHVMEENEIVSNFESLVYRRDGSSIWISENSRAVRGKSGRLLYYEGNVEDISERKKTQLELAKAKTAAEAANKAKSDFLATISHELRTPLNGIIGMTSIIRDTSLDANQLSFLQIIDESGQALLQLVNDVLDFSKIEAGQIDFAQVEFDPEQTIETAINFVTSSAQDKNLELSCMINQNLPARLCGDPSRLRQVLLNLLGNAIKFTEKGEVWLTVSKEEETDRTITLCFSIRDTGIGMNPETLPLLFQPFTQGDGSTTRKYGGTGLGLAIARKIVTGLKGNLGVESQLERGSTFWFTARFDKVAGSKETDKVFREEHALILTRNTATGIVLKKYLEAIGITLHFAHTLREISQVLPAAESNRISPHWIFTEEAFAAELATSPSTTEQFRGATMVLLHTLKERPKLTNWAGGLYNLQKPVHKTCLLELIAAKPITMQRHDLPASPLSPGTIPPNLRILLAEDNTVNQKVALKMLKKLGHDPAVANNGNEVLEKIPQGFDVILMDCQMPELDGYETTRKIRQNERELNSSPMRIIALTANAMVGDREKCLSFGMDDYISKPFKIEELQKVIGRIAIL